MSRVTESMLQSLVDRLNRETGSPMKPYDNWIAQPGCYKLDSAYGGHMLRHITKHGGEDNVLGTGYIPKKDLYAQIHAYLIGVTTAKEETNES